MPATLPRLQASHHSPLTRAVLALRTGQLAVLTDQRGNTADLVSTAAHASVDSISFMAREGCGLIAVALSADRVERLQLRPMAAVWGTPCKPFTVSVDAREGITTGISAAERAHTIRTVVAPATQPEDLVAPGHVFPLRAQPPGHSGQGGRTEAALALAALAGCPSGAVLCEILDQAGELADAAGARQFARRHGLPAVDIAVVLAATERGPGAVARAAAGTQPCAEPSTLARGSEDHHHPSSVTSRPPEARFLSSRAVGPRPAPPSR